MRKLKFYMYFEDFKQPYFSEKKLENIRTLLGLKKYSNQIMISNNINFKTQLKTYRINNIRYGGFGYSNLFENYLKLIKNLSEEEIISIFSTNLLKLLEWWREPCFEVKSVKTITCYMQNKNDIRCEKVQPEEDDNFKKFEFIYCSVKCLNKHKLLNFVKQ